MAVLVRPVDRGIEDRVTPQHGDLQPLQVRARVQTELVGQAEAGLSACGQGILTPAGAVQRHHQVGDEPFVERIGRHEVGQLADERLVPAQREIGVKAQIQRRPAQLVEAGTGRVRYGLPAVGQCLATPE